ncbi:MAG: endonuclease III [Clostridia bacterium]
MTLLTKDEVALVLSTLNTLYPDARPMLSYDNAFELLIAAILSAQCSDTRVNIVTSELFSRYKTPSDFAALTTDELIPIIHSCGLYKMKSKHIIEACKKIENDYAGEVPKTLAELMTLAGVGQKVANVVLYNAFSIPAIAVDTHVFRVSNRIGLADAKTPEKTEQDLKNCIPMELWGSAHHMLIFHGRSVCKSQKPACNDCALNNICLRKEVN